MKGKVLALTIIFTLILGQSVALGGGLLEGIGKGFQSICKQYAKESDREHKARMKRQEKAYKGNGNMATNKQMEKALKDVEDMEKPPLQRSWLQKIDIYKEVIEKSKNNPSTIQDVIDHIEIFGHKKYGDKLSEKHKDFQKELKDKKRTILKERLQEKTKNDFGKKVKDTATGITILGGIAYILRAVILKSPM